jgi:hypothetical protein
MWTSDGSKVSERFGIEEKGVENAWVLVCESKKKL